MDKNDAMYSRIGKNEASSLVPSVHMVRQIFMGTERPRPTLDRSHLFPKRQGKEKLAPNFITRNALATNGGQAGSQGKCCRTSTTTNLFVEEP